MGDERLDAPTGICSLNKHLLMSSFPSGLGTVDTQMPPVPGDTVVEEVTCLQIITIPWVSTQLLADLYEPSLAMVVENVRGSFFKDLTFERVSKLARQKAREGKRCSS